MSELKLSTEQIAQNIKKLQEFCEQQDLDVFYISSFDHYLSEYVPLYDCHRYFFSGFTGSVAEMLVPKNGKAKIFVDGRYHEQVDNEVDQNYVEAVKVEHGDTISEAMFRTIENLGAKKIGCEGDRCSIKFEKRFN